MESLSLLYDGLLFLSKTSHMLPYEFCWMNRIYNTRRAHPAYPSPLSSSWTPIYTLITGFLVATAGGTIVDVLCGRPPGWIRIDSLYLTALFLVFFTPFHKLYETQLVQWVVVGGEAISWARALAGSIFSATHVFPGSYAAILLIAIIGGSAGGLVSQFELRSWARTPAELSLLSYSPTGVHLSLILGVVSSVLLSLEYSHDVIMAVITASIVGAVYLMKMGVEVDPIKAIISFTTPTRKAKVSIKKQK